MDTFNNLSKMHVIAEIDLDIELSYSKIASERKRKRWWRQLARETYNSGRG